MMEQSKRSAALYLAAVFIAGGAVGYALSEFSSQPTAEASVNTASAYRRNLLETLDQRLALSDDQLGEVIVIFDDIDDRYWEVRDAMEPEFEAIRLERAEQVMAYFMMPRKTPTPRVAAACQPANIIFAWVSIF